MSLRLRLLAAMLVAFLASFAVGAAIDAVQARRLVRAELQAALADGQRDLAAALAADPRGPAPALPLPRLIASFDGSRHITAAWHRAGGEDRSLPATPATPAPPWFQALMAVQRPASRVALADGGDITLTPFPGNEVSERWAEFRERVALQGLSMLLATLLGLLTLARGLAPLTALLRGLARLEGGVAAITLPAAGPPEIARLAVGFNRMSAALQELEQRNQRMATQLLTLAEEERAEIARDLHDEVGPLLFAITTFAASIRAALAAGETASIPPQLQAITEAVGTLQGEVREMLGRLREDAGPGAPDLPDAIARLCEFWRRIRPDLHFDLAIEAALPLTPAQRETLYRVAQEAVSNAVRHGGAGRIELTVRRRVTHVELIVADDGRGGEAQAGFGLAGMAERMAALGGRFAVARDAGWRVIASLPLVEAAA